MRRRLAAAVAALCLGVLARARRAAAGIPVSSVFAGRRVGADFLARRGLGDGTYPDGEMDDLGAFADEAFDPDAVAPAVRGFYEQTGEYDLAYRVRWHRGFRLGAALATHATRRLGQLALPAPGDAGVRRLRSEFVGLATDADPRDDARAWTRTDPETGEAVFVALYAHHERGGVRYVNIAVPLPGANLSTVLRPRTLPEGGLELTTDAPGDPGLYLVTPLGAFALPMAQRFRVWPAGTRGAPAAPVDADLVATHEMWLLGRQFLTVTYGIGR